uniref:TIR domain-containing protein n=1 Tax=Strigamia maritima TaxID=126957 RepID=T1IV19_STRMM
MAILLHIFIILLTSCSIYSLQTIYCKKREIYTTLCNLESLSDSNFSFLDADTLQLELICISEITTAKMFPSGKFKHLHQLKNLAIANCSFLQIGSGAFQGLKSLTTLKIHGKHNKEISENLFDPTPQLDIIFFSFNNLEYLPARIFRNLKSIIQIHLSNNQLFFNQSSKDTFKGLHSLRLLDLRFNQIDYLPLGIFDDLTSLLDLYLRNNLLQQVNDNNFRFLTKLKFLDLNNNNLTKTTEKAFETLTHLMQLHLGNNQLKYLPNLQNLTSLTNLYIYSNNVADIASDSFLHLNQLRILFLWGNKIKVLKNRTFQNLPNLIEINLQICEINFIEEDTFQYLSILTMPFNKVNEMRSSFVKVKEKLDLAFNNIQMFDFESINPELKVIDLSNNRLRVIKTSLSSAITHKLEYFYANNNQLEICSVSHFPLTIRHILMENNNIIHIDQFTADILPQLEILDLKNNLIREISDKDFQYTTIPLKKPIVHLTSNPIICSCKNNWMLFTSTSRYPSISFINTYCIVTYSRIEKYVSWLSIRTINKSELMCENTKTCLSQCRCFFNDELSIMDCFNVTWEQPTAIVKEKFTTIFFDGNINIGSVVSILLTNSPTLQTLYLNNSGLMIISKDMFQGVPGLKELYLEENQLQYISPDVFMNLPKLKILSLYKNKLQQPQFWKMALPHLSEITFSENNFVCDCEFIIPFKKWAIEHQLEITFPDLDITYCNSSTVPITNFIDSSCLVDNQNIKLILIIAPTGSILSFLVIFGILLYLYRLEMKVWLYSRYGVRLFYNKDADIGKVYSAFISYADEDEDWMIEELLPRLDDYKLCIHQRDFPFGDKIESLLQAVESSCRTVVILTPNYLKSDWCLFEFDTAHMQSLQDKCKRLVVVLLEAVDKCEMNKNLSAYLKTNTYLDINDALVWEKLKFALPNNEILQEQNETHF